MECTQQFFSREAFEIKSIKCHYPDVTLFHLFHYSMLTPLQFYQLINKFSDVKKIMSIDNNVYQNIQNNQLKPTHLQTKTLFKYKQQQNNTTYYELYNEQYGIQGHSQEWIQIFLKAYLKLFLFGGLNKEIQKDKFKEFIELLFQRLNNLLVQATDSQTNQYYCLFASKIINLLLLDTSIEEEIFSENQQFLQAMTQIIKNDIVNTFDKQEFTNYIETSFAVKLGFGEYFQNETSQGVIHELKCDILIFTESLFGGIYATSQKQTKILIEEGLFCVIEKNQNKGIYSKEQQINIQTLETINNQIPQDSSQKIRDKYLEQNIICSNFSSVLEAIAYFLIQQSNCPQSTDLESAKQFRTNLKLSLKNNDFKIQSFIIEQFQYLVEANELLSLIRCLDNDQNIQFPIKSYEIIPNNQQTRFIFIAFMMWNFDRYQYNPSNFYKEEKNIQKLIERIQQQYKFQESIQYSLPYYEKIMNYITNQKKASFIIHQSQEHIKIQTKQFILDTSKTFHQYYFQSSNNIIYIPINKQKFLFDLLKYFVNNQQKTSFKLDSLILCLKISNKIITLTYMVLKTQICLILSLIAYVLH